MRRTELQRRTPLRNTSGLGAGGGKGKRSKRKPVSPAASGQRAKVLLEGRSRISKTPAEVARLDPMHVVDRSLGGCDDPLCVIPATRPEHDAYDAHNLDVLAYLTVEEQAHAVSHLGLSRAYKRITGVAPYENEREAA